MKRVRIALLTLVILFASINVDARNTPKSLIILIGDGMGLSQITMLMAERGYAPTQMDRAENVVLTKTNSLDDTITDSAAAGTALASGHKTNNGMIGRTPDGIDRPSILSYASSAGKSTGVVATCEIQHATPAAFYAHADSRLDYSTISDCLANSFLDVAIAGGSSYLSVENVKTIKKRKARYVTSMSELTRQSKTPLVALVTPGTLPSIKDGRDSQYLTKATSKAIDLLSRNKEGFVLMVEGSQIDWAGHNNNAESTMLELLDFERAVKISLDYADRNPGTLVVVTSDHETGGLTLTKEVGQRLEAQKIRYQYSTGNHTGVMVPALLYGTGSYSINGVMNNNELSLKLREVLQLNIN